MKYKNNKGVTGVDLSVSLIIVVLFVLSFFHHAKIMIKAE